MWDNEWVIMLRDYGNERNCTDTQWEIDRVTDWKSENESYANMQS